MDLSPEPGWERFEAWVLHDEHAGRTFVRGEPHGERIRVRYFRRQTDDALVGKVVFGPACEGPPGHAHGGSTAALLDDAMGVCAWMAKHEVVAGQIKIQFRAPMPLEHLVMVEASIGKIEGKRVVVKSRLYDAGRTYVEGEGVFVNVGKAKFREWLDAKAKR